MSLTASLFMPLVLLLPAAGTAEPQRDFAEGYEVVDQEEPAKTEGLTETPADSVTSSFQEWPLVFVSHGFRPESAYQVRIERRMTIRIAPRPSPVRPNSFVGVPATPLSPRVVERKIGKCLPVSRISGVQANGGNNLLLFLRDRRVVSARLERACRAKDFYSGFYLSRSNDGNLCVDRDALQSRSGANCKLTRIRQLVEVAD